jgi:serine protease Do
MRYRELTLAFVVVAVLATVMAFSGTGPADTERAVTALGGVGGPEAAGYLGLVAQSRDDGTARGTLVKDVLGDGPADKAGIRRGDVITSFDGRPVTGGANLQLRVAETRPGTTVRVAVSRDGQDLIVTVELGERPARIALTVLRATTVPA